MSCPFWTGAVEGLRLAAGDCNATLAAALPSLLPFLFTLEPVEAATGPDNVGAGILLCCGVDEGVAVTAVLSSASLFGGAAD
ncbi:hypothetical protein D3C75_965800 [compost metagenome]